MSDTPPPDMDALRRRAAEIEGRERVRALLDLGMALGRAALAEETGESRRPLLDEAIEVTETAHVLLDATGEASDAGLRTDVALWLVKLLTSRQDPTSEADLDRCAGLLREALTSGSRLPPEKAEGVRLMLGLLLLRQPLRPYLGRGATGFAEAVGRFMTGDTSELEEAIDVLGRIREPLLPADLRPLPPPMRLILTSARMLVEAKSGALTPQGIFTVMQKIQTLLTGDGQTVFPPQIADTFRGLARGIELRVSADPARARKLAEDLEPLKDSAGPLRTQILQNLAFAYAMSAGGEADTTELVKAREALADVLDDLDDDDPQSDGIRVSLAAVQYVLATFAPTPEAVEEAVAVARRLTVPARPEDPPQDVRQAWNVAALGSALALRSWLGDGGSLGEAEKRLATVLPFAAGDAELAAYVLPSLGLVLVQRGVGGLADTHLGRDLMMKGLEIHATLADADVGTLPDPLVRGGLGLLSLLFPDADDNEDARLKRAITHLTAAADAPPATSAFRPLWLVGLGMARLRHGLQSDDPAEVRAAADIVDGYVAEGGTGQWGTLCEVASALGRLYAGVREEDAATFDRGLTSLLEALDVIRPPYGDRVLKLRTIGLARLLRAQFFGGNREDLDECVRVLEEARALAADRPRWLRGTEIPAYLSEAHAERGDLTQAVDAGLDALRAYAAEVLLQTTPDHGLSAARGAAALARRITEWCLRDGRPEAAVHALELGRGLVLYASTVAADVPELLGDGHSELAEKWRTATEDSARSSFSRLFAAATPARPEESASDYSSIRIMLMSEDVLHGLLGDLAERSIPTDLRHEVLKALTESPKAAGLFDPPGPADIAAALSTISMDALVYLQHGAGTESGYAVVVWADGRLDTVELPRLTQDDIPLDENAHQDGVGKAGLEPLCDWAWDAAIGPLLDLFPDRTSGDAPRIVLVPCGMLGVVPWHAARTVTAEGRPRHAVQDLVISYAATGRQLIDKAKIVAARAGEPLAGSRPPADVRPTFVANPRVYPDPDDELVYAFPEAKAISKAFYPGSTVLGRPKKLTHGLGTVEAILDALPHAGSTGAEVLHLACHGTTRNPPTRSVLYLHPADQTGELDVRSIIERARDRPVDAPGGLVVLSACTSNLAAYDHDEALTLATAFLTAGCACVVGSRWRVPDFATAVLMFMFHHFLVEEEHPPVDALRLAQLWMLDSGRSVPGTLPEPLSGNLSLLSDADLTDIYVWAAFTHQGALAAKAPAPPA
ncbi:CHAT domain-containing protein [Actinomadura sp. 9N215]|uniref:CHAT domain-containing protein n=1 Tax=Actinomadura sp. 9N215 TaxID=3375150 RepID=UPI0037A6506A